VLFNKHKLHEKLEAEAMRELDKAAECLSQLEMDSAPLQTLTSYSIL